MVAATRRARLCVEGTITALQFLDGRKCEGAQVGMFIMKEGKEESPWLLMMLLKEWLTL